MNNWILNFAPIHSFNHFKRVYLRVHLVLPLSLSRQRSTNLEHSMCSWQHSHIQLQEFLWMIVVWQYRYVHFVTCVRLKWALLSLISVWVWIIHDVTLSEPIWCHYPASKGLVPQLLTDRMLRNNFSMDKQEIFWFVLWNNIKSYYNFNYNLPSVSLYYQKT